MIKAFLQDYLALCKPRVVALMILTSVVGMCLATPQAIPLAILFWGNLGITCIAFSAAALNHVADQHIDKLMSRTQYRPIVSGKVTTRNSLIFATFLGLAGIAVLSLFVNVLTAGLAFLSLIGYAVCYTLYLKHATPQNIVIGGIAGSAPPLLGWTAVTGSISPAALLLVLIVYVWTPPHFWALAIYRYDDYARAKIPMLPNTHGIAYTKLNIVLYTALLVCAATMPYVIHMAGMIYLVCVTLANLGFIYQALRLYYSSERKNALFTFHYSIYYLGWLFLALLVDHYYFINWGA